MAEALIDPSTEILQFDWFMSGVTCPVFARSKAKF